MKLQRFRKYLTDYNISLLIRWWAAGAVYFFVGWGTFLGNQQSLIDFVFSLGLIMGLFNIFIINPVLRLMFKLGPARPPREYSYWQRLRDYAVELVKSVFIAFIIALIYMATNMALIALLSLPAEAVPLPGEPILFGMFYVLVFVLLEIIVKMVMDVIKNSPVSSRKRS